MAAYDNLRAVIAANVYQNNNNEVTADMVKAAMNAMVASLGAEFQFGGMAEPGDNPGTPDYKVAYLAAKPGTYSNFGGIIVADGEVVLMKWDGSWEKEITGAATAEQLSNLAIRLEPDALTINVPADTAFHYFQCFIPANTDFNLTEVSGTYWSGGAELIIYSGDTVLHDTGKTYTRNDIRGTYNFNLPVTKIGLKIWAATNTDCVFSLQNPTSIWVAINAIVVPLVSFAASDSVSGVSAKGQMYYNTNTQKIRRVTNNALTQYADVAFNPKSLYLCRGAIYAYDGVGLSLAEKSWKFSNFGDVNDIIKEIYAATKPSDFEEKSISIYRAYPSGTSYINRIRIGNENIGSTGYVNIQKVYATQEEAIADSSKELVLESSGNIAIVDMSAFPAGEYRYFYNVQYYDIFNVVNSPRIRGILNRRDSETAFILLGSPLGIISGSTELGDTDVELGVISNLSIKQFYLDIRELKTSSVYVAIRFDNSPTIFSSISFYSGFHKFNDTINRIRVYANHLIPTEEIVSVKAVLFENDASTNITTAEPTPFDYMEQAMNLSCGIDAAAQENGTSKFDEIRAASSNPNMDNVACAIIYNLRKAGYDRKIPYGYYLDWETQNRYLNNADIYCEQVGGVWRPRPVADIDLTDATLAQLAGGPAPSMNMQDFYTCIGNDFLNENHAKNRAAMIGSIQKTWAVSKVLQVLSWHLENPYAPADYNTTKYRYRDSHNVVHEILNNTGSACGFSEEYPAGQFANPKEWFDYRCGEVAALIQEFVDEENEYIPIIFRLWHEMEDNWAWWQLGYGVSIEDYKAFFAYSVEKINELAGTNRILFAFCSDKYLRRPAQDTLAEYVPLDYVDIVSFDYYGIDDENEIENAIGYAREFTLFAERNGKICAISETGVFSGGSKVDFYNGCARVISAPGVRICYLNSWLNGSAWLPTESTAIKNGFARFLKRQNFYNINTMQDLTTIQ